MARNETVAGKLKIQGRVLDYKLSTFCHRIGDEHLIWGIISITSFYTIYQPQLWGSAPAFLNCLKLALELCDKMARSHGEQSRTGIFRHSPIPLCDFSPQLHNGGSHSIPLIRRRVAVLRLNCLGIGSIFYSWCAVSRH